MEKTIAALADAGFDLAHPFDAGTAAREPGLERLAGPNMEAGGFTPTAGVEQLGILIGNTRALWPAFVAAMREPELAADPQPLERYTEQTIERVFAGARVYYGHRRYDGEFLPLQRLAVVTGLGAMAPSRLVVHPIYGPWFALRAVIVIAGAPVTCAPIVQPCRCEAPCTDALEAALEARGPESWRAWLAVRDACTLRAWRYSDDQIRYHYTKVWLEP